MLSCILIFFPDYLTQLSLCISLYFYLFFTLPRADCKKSVIYKRMFRGPKQKKQ